MNVINNDTLKVSQNYELVKENDDLKELGISQGINVWGTSQEVLEEQALHELQIFTDDCTKGNDIEDGEIIENEDVIKSENVNPTSTLLDIESYIKRQVEFKKRQDYIKSISVSDHSKEAARKSGSHANKDYKCHKNKKIKTGMSEDNDAEHDSSQSSLDVVAPRGDVNSADSADPANTNAVDNRIEDNSGSEYVPSEDEQDSDYNPHTVQSGTKKITVKEKKGGGKLEFKEKVQDDGLLKNYKSRLALYYKQLEEEISLKRVNNDDEDEEYHLLSGGLKVPTKLWNNLYGYQQEGIKWLWNIHQKSTGGLLGDEMGLGKTVQIIVFLHSLECSRIMSCHGRFNGLGPSLIVCPATVIHQWVKHFHDWAPEIRVAVLHQSGSYQGNKAELIKQMHKSKGVIITTYYGILKYKGNLLEHTWHYVILDEGHKVRNPTAKVTVAVKQFTTPHKIMLTGSPMQNNLTELWSLFDFTNPGMLGNLMTFQEHFATPILHGGFSNSTPMQEATALSVATTLKNIISPYLLRRSKKEVQDHISLPNKSEQVLFCSLTNEQKDLYKGYLMSEHVNMILGRGKKNWSSENQTRANILVAITTLRKICNHPDIYLSGADDIKYNEDISTDDRFGYYKRSGKMIVVSALLKIWKKQGHRVLLFTQSRSMIAIFQDFLEHQGYKYLKMDGSTSVSSRQTLINKFNEDSSYDVFLLTTRVGGLGVNLTGANRVIIFDPDWNPATDTQARERAWRIGQEKNVTIYRLLSAGTIEEKMYQRQVWKQLLSNKVLLDPRTNKFFRNSDLHDLFSLQESPDANPETANIFHDSRVRIQENIKLKNKEKQKKKDKIKPSVEGLSQVQFTEDKIQAMKNLAQQIAKSLTQKREEKVPAKTSFRSEIEEERQIKLAEKAKLKKLTPQELLHYNKEKAKQTEDETINKIDDLETEASFSKALEYSETTSKLHHELISGKVKDPEIVINKVIDIRKDIAKVKDGDGSALSRKRDDSCIESDGEMGKKKDKKKKDRDKTVIDKSGTIDGERVEGLVKSESQKSRKRKRKEMEDVESQDDFVLGKLFAKTGVSGALQHESIIRSGSQVNSLKIHTEARIRAEKSLEALRKSRLDNWRW